MPTRLTAALLALALSVTLLTPTVQEVKALSDSGFIFSVGTETAAVHGCDGACPIVLQIPSMLGGKRVTTILGAAFQNQSLISVEIPNTVEYIGNQAFRWNSLTSVVIPDSVTYIGQSAFIDNQIENLTLGQSVQTIDIGAFTANQITTLIIPDSVTTIGYWSFYNNRISSLSLGSSVTTIGSGAFYRNLLTSLTIPESLSVIKKESFRCNPIASLVIGANVEIIEEDAFSSSRNGNGCGASRDSRLTSLVIPDNVKKIGSRAFAFSRLTSISIGNKLTSIGSYAFELNKLSTLTLPRSVTEIGNGAFRSNSLNQVSFLGDAPIGGVGVFDGNVSLASIGRYAESVGWGSIWSGVEVKTIEIPSNTGAPSISGESKLGGLLSVSTGTWNGYPLPMFSFQWYQCAGTGTGSPTVPSDCEPIFGAIDSAYHPVEADHGRYVRARVTASNVVGISIWFTGSTSVVIGQAPVNLVVPEFSGTAQVGSALSGLNGSWSGTPTPTYGYVWARCSATGSASATLPVTCTLIDDAAISTYTLVNADYNNYLRVGVTATSIAGTATMYSATTAKVTGAAPTNTLVPSISGTAKVATQLTGSPGTWTGYPIPVHSFSWFSCTSSGSASATLPSGCTAISGATINTFTPTSTQVGKYLRLKVTATSTAGSTFYFSAATATVAAAAANTTAPAVSGTLKVGSTLTGSKGSWSGTPTPTYGFVWARCSATGSASATLPGTCTLIDGAASSTYVLASADYNKYLRVGVTATNSAGSATMYSAATAIIAGGLPANTLAPSISGTAKVATQLIGSPGTWGGYPAPSENYAYAWFRCTGSGSASATLPSGCTAISGATVSTFTPTSTQVGKYLRLKVTATSTAGSTFYFSAATAMVIR